VRFLQNICRSPARKIIRGGPRSAPGGDKVGYSRAISSVGRGFIMRHYQSHGGVKPPPIDHLGIEDAFVDKASIVHYFYRGKRMELTGAD